MKTYQARQGKVLVVVSAVFSVVCLGITLATRPWVMRGAGGLSGGVLGWLPVAVVAGCLPFMIRGYAIAEDAILVKRLFWTTRLARAGLQSAEVVPDAMCKSLRTCGNGGAFSFSGWYWSKALGHYRAFVTNPNDAVVLRFDKRTVVLSPATPDGFVRELNC